MPLIATKKSRLPYVHTAVYYFSFVVLGLSSAVVGPALNAFAANTNTALNVISAIFVAGALGRTVGALGVGRLYDKLHGRGHVVLIAGFIGMAAIYSFINTVNVFWVLMAVVFVLGIAEVFVDVGCNTLLVQTHTAHNIKVAPFMNGLHLMFGVGAFFVPLVVANSLTRTGDARWAFWLAACAATLILPVLWRTPSPVPKSAHATTGSTTRQPNDMRLVLLFAVFFFLFVGNEVVFANWSFNYGKSFGLDDIGAGALNSTFFAGFMFGRLIAIPIGARFKARHILLADGLGGVLACLLLLMAPQASLFLWLGFFVAGLAIASMFATTLVFAEEKLQLNGGFNGIILAASNLGAMFFPWLVGQLFEARGAQTVVWVGLGSALVSLAVFGVVWQRMSKSH